MSSPDKSLFDQLMAFTRKWEGGYADKPNDKGGPTNQGVTQGVYDGYRKKKKLSLQSVKLISREEVNEIYFNQYWKPSRAAYMDFPLNQVVLDTAINLGVGRCNQFLAEAFGLPAKLSWNPTVSTLIHDADPREIAVALIALRMEWRGRRVIADETQSGFLKGWLNRDRDLLNLVRSGK